MSTRQWTRRLFPQSARAGRSAAVRRRPVIEALEERALLTGYSVANVSDLIAAIVSSNTAGGANTITLTADNSSPYTLAAVDNTTDGATGLPVIAAGNVLTIVGDGDTIERSTADGTPALRLLDVAAGATLNLQDLTLQNGLADDPGVTARGGAIFSQGTLSLDTVTLQNNTASGNDGSGDTPGLDAQGGAIYVGGGSITLTNAVAISNTAQGGNVDNGGTTGAGGNGGDAQGGALYAAAGTTVTLTASTVSSDTAQGGNGADGGDADADVNSGGGNGGVAQGGALYVAAGTTVTLTASTISSDTAQGGDGGAGAVDGGDGRDDINSVGGNGGVAQGGALYVTAATTVTLTASIVSSDTAHGGDGGDDGVSGDFQTVAGNAGDGQGGALCAAAGTTVTLTASTLSSNIAQGGDQGLALGIPGRDGIGGVGQGGALYFAGMTATLTTPTFSFNTAQGGAGASGEGGAFCSAAGTTTLASATFTGNVAQAGSFGARDEFTIASQGGGIMVAGGSVAISDSTLSENNAQGSFYTEGGGIAILGGSVEMANTTVSDNNLQDTGSTILGGGGLFVDGGASATLTGCTFSGNGSVPSSSESGVEGGGLANGDSRLNAIGGTLILTDCSVRGNFASLGGGLFFGKGGTTTLVGCTFTGNTASASGGGICIGSQSATATLTDCTVTGNSAGEGGGGIAALEDRNFALTDCTVSDNTAVSYGGGLVLEGPATLSECTVTGNTVTGNAPIGGPGYGGGLDIEGPATLTNCLVSSNSAGEGGGIVIMNSFTFNLDESTTSELTGCTITGNAALVAAGGLEIGHVNRNGDYYSPVAATLTNCTISGNTAGTDGGGLSLVTNGTASLLDCTVSGNTAFDGGGVYNLGVAILTNTTVAGNVATHEGGGLFSAFNASINVIDGTTTLTNCTVSADSAGVGGGGMFVDPRFVFAPVTLNNTIVANQTSGGDVFLFNLDLNGGHNLFSDFAYTANSIVADPKLAPLGDYGGPTETMALLPGSPAIDAGISGAGVPTTDQRGTARDAQPDIGAFEVSAATSLAVAGFPSPTTAGVAQAFTVTALDAYGNVATDYTGTARFTSSDGQAVLPANYTFTSAIGGDIGVHTFTATLETAGTQSITAADTVNASITGNESGITVNPAAASTLIISGSPSVAIAGDPTSFTVTALDPFGNIATGYDGTLSFSSTDPKAVLPGDSSLTDGTGTFTATLESAGLRFISAVDTVNGGVSGTGSAISVHAATASSLLVNGFPSPVTAGVPESFTLIALDPFGNVATRLSSSLHISTSDAQATLPGLTLFAAEGSFTATLRTAGTQSITVSGGLLSGTQSGITVNPAAASTLLVSGFRSSVVAGVAGSFTVTAFDPFGNVATGDTSTLNFSSSDNQATLPAGSTLTAGTGSFSATLKTAGSQSISASDGTASGTQSGITVSPAATRQFLVTGFPSPTTAGVGGTFTVTAEDPYGNATPDYDGKVKFTSSDGQASLPAKIKLTGGTGSFTATLSTAGEQSITGTDTTTSTITGSQVGITVNPAAGATLIFGQKPSDATAGVAISPAVTVIVEDQFNNVVTGNGSTVTLTLSAGTFEGGSSTAAAAVVNGVATFGSLKIDAAGKYTVSATDRTLIGTGASKKFTISPAATSTLVMTGFPSPVTAGTAGSFTVTAEDAFGNTTPDYQGKVHFTSSDGQASLPADFTFNSGTHTFKATLKTAGAQTITVTDAATGTLTVTQAGITVNPAAASKLIVSAPPSAASGTPFSITVTAVDGYGNVATGYTGTVTFTSSDKQAVLPEDYTFTGADSGVHAFTVTLAKLGNQTITVRDTATKSINGTATVTVDSADLVAAMIETAMPTSSSTRPKRGASGEPTPIS